MRAMGFVKKAGFLVFEDPDNIAKVENLITALTAAVKAKERKDKATKTKQEEERRQAQEGSARAQMTQTLTSQLSRMRIYEVSRNLGSKKTFL